MYSQNSSVIILKFFKMKGNQELQTDVQNDINWEPLLNAAEIGVTVKDAVVSLTGVVDSYAKKLAAEYAAKKVLGVKALVEKIEVEFPNSWSKTNVEIANEVLVALRSNWLVPEDKVTVKVEIKPDTKDTIEQKDVEYAIVGSLSVDGADISVLVSGTTVTLSGTVDSWYQKDEAGHIAWKTPGIRSVRNELAVDYEFAFS